MNFYSVRDLRTQTKQLWSELDAGNEVVLTNNGRPSALMVHIPEGAFEETVRAVRQAKAMIAFNSIRQRAAENGYMTDEEVESLVDEARGLS